MNIVEFINKIKLNMSIPEEVALAYTIILFFVNFICSFKFCRDFNEPIWQAFIPIYNLKVVFKYCWNMKKFIVHCVLETLSLLLPLLYEASGRETIILWVLDIIVSLGAIVHGIELGINNLKAYGYGKTAIPLIFFFNGSLLLTAFGQNEYIGNFSK